MDWYTGDSSYDTPLTIALAIVAITTVAALFMQTPYGRFASGKWGVSLDPRLGWFLMELPATVVFLAFFFRGPSWNQPFALFMLFLWSCHYLNRGWLMPALMRVPKGGKSSFSLMVVTIGWVVTSLHGYLNARWANEFHPDPSWSWFADPRFIVGALIYYAGLAMNLHADHIVRTLRSKEEVESGEKVYRIPRGGLFRYVTNAPYFTELMLWTGFAILTWSMAGVYILTISMANLIPRAFATHKWYQERFDDYPEERRVLIPGVL